MDKQRLTLDGASYTICLPDAATDYIQGKIYSTKEPYELDMLRHMASRLNKDDLVLDVGANIGNHSLYLASVASCRIEAFEPNKKLCEALQVSIALNALEEHVVIHQAGVSDAPGFARFSHMDESNLGAQSLEVSNKAFDEVRLVSLDEMTWTKSVSMIKIDVEGMEWNVLQGAVALLKRDKPVLYIEAHDLQKFEKLYSYLFDLGYLYCETYNATPTHCFVHEATIRSPLDLADSLLVKARSIYSNKKSLEDLKEKNKKTRNALSEAKQKYRDVCKKITALQEKLRDTDTKYSGACQQITTLQEKLDATDAKYRSACQQITALQEKLDATDTKYSDACQQINVLQEKLDAANVNHNEANTRYEEALVKYRAANAKYRVVCQRLSALKSSQPYQAGLYVKAASSSWRDAVKLPIRLWRIKTSKRNQPKKRINLYQKLRYIKWKFVIPLATRLGIPQSKVEYLTVPHSVKDVARRFKHKALKSQAQGHDEAAQPPQAFVPPSSAAQEISILGWPDYPSNGKPYVIGVMDEFTTGCFEKEVNLIQPRPDNWYALAEKYQPVLFFIESAWKGNYGSWQYRVGDYTNKPGQEVAHICQYARKKGIPTLFWNKEDPVHHQKFMCSAKLVDHIFTTDANMKRSYQAKTGNANVHALPFAAQPSLHKPAPLAGRKPRACFAGSWYSNRHAKRGKSMRWLLQAANRYGLDIYDRNHGTGIFPFPQEYQAGVKGSLPYKKLCDEYRRYRIFLNVNSVTDSPTMFSRRVFELMASGTPVVSTYAKGIENLFESRAVWLVNSQEEADVAIRTLMHDDVEWRRRSLAGIREVFARHTYAHRLNDIFGRLGIEERLPTDPAIALVAAAHSQAELEALDRFARKQRYDAFRLGVACSPGIASLAGTLSERITVLRMGQEAPWVAERQTEHSIAGWITPSSHYGEHYLRDLANATLYEPQAAGWAKSLEQDRFAYGDQAVLAGALWQTSEFLEQYIKTHPDEYLTHPDLYLADSDQFQHSHVAQQQVVGAEP
ncbi:FkbM family methyltransferase [Pistricoccus aurantiacus]|uniref:FkbM family methyltransferase n=1 Tax=Pistricoccus aurantiacus TaxID=1883414 RepID=UPI0036310219